MKHYHLTITAKTEKSLYNLLNFLENIDLNLNVIKKVFKKEKKKKILTLLKSPHVNKTAQEQFQSNFFSTQINIYSNSNFQSLIVLKKITNTLFPDTKINITFPGNRNLSNKIQTQIFNPNNFKFNNEDNILLNQKYKLSIRKKKNYKFIENNIQIFDIYGEITL
jgi:hypothetical protein